MYKYIAVSGTIGAGKTELATLLAENLKSHLILEEFASNTFLDKFYAAPLRYAFPLEISFLFERFQQLKTAFAQADLFNPGFVSDYFFDKSLLFAKNNLTADQFSVFLGLFNAFREQVPKPDLLLYLHRPVNVLMKNIERRGRNFEQKIDACYLDALQSLYMVYLKTLTGMTVRILKLEDKDFLRDHVLFNDILRICKNKAESAFGIVEF